MNLFKKLIGMRSAHYKVHELVKWRALEPVQPANRRLHVICDIDKTYLETEFESFLKMARIPFEAPEEKITVEGASQVLQDLRWNGVQQEWAEHRRLIEPTGIHFVSSSPPQLREKLEGKLVLDRVDWTSDSFKNQGYNLRMARIDLLRHHIAYKSLAILQIVRQLAPGSQLIMIGDSAESDSYIYVGIKFLVERVLSKEQFGEWLAAAMVERKVIAQIVETLDQLPENLSIRAIFIRKLPRELIAPTATLNDCIFYFEHFFQVAWALMDSGFITWRSLWSNVRQMHNDLNISRAQLAQILQTGADFGCASEDLQREAIACIHRLGGLVPGTKVPAWRLRKLQASTSPAPRAADILAAGVDWYDALSRHRTGKKH